MLCFLACCFITNSESTLCLSVDLLFVFPLASGFLQQQEQEHLGDDGATLAGSPGPSSRSRLHKSKDKVMNSNFLCMLSHNILIVFVVCPTFASCLLTYPKPLKAYFSWCFFVNQTICGCSMFTH